MPKIITEDMIEQAAIQTLHDVQGYDVLRCYTEDPEELNDNTGRSSKKQVILPAVLLESLIRINPGIPEATVRSVAEELCKTLLSGDLMLTNYYNYQKIRNGIQVQYQENGRNASNLLRVIDFAEPKNNSLLLHLRCGFVVRCTDAGRICCYSSTDFLSYSSN